MRPAESNAVRGFQADYDIANDPFYGGGEARGGLVGFLPNDVQGPRVNVPDATGERPVEVKAPELDLDTFFTAGGGETELNPTTDTVPANTSTTFSVTVDGAAVTGYINSGTDRDWFRVDLVAGQYYEFTMDPSGTLDAVLQLRGSNGAIITSADGADAFQTETIGFYAQTSGTYFLTADGFQSTTGQYTLSAVTAPFPNILDTINWGGDDNITGVDANGVILVYFAQAGEVFDGVSSLGWNQLEIDAAMAAFAQFENIIDVDFQITTNSAEADFKLVTTTSSQYLGYFNPPGTTNAGVGVFARNGTGWDETDPNGGLQQGGFGFITLIHEIGHGMGLAHPHDTGGGSSVMLGVTSPFNSYGLYGMNQGVWTTMSYNDGWPLGENGDSPSVAYGYQGTLMALDVALLQIKYGANENFNGGDTVYDLDTANAPGAFYSAIWDTGGADTIRYTGAASSVIDLRPATLEYAPGGAGYMSWVDDIFGGFTIANGVVIENASGGSGADAITGNDAANALAGNDGVDDIDGGAGDDTITGGAGDDTLDGGAGDDTFVFAAGHGVDTITGFVAGGTDDQIEVSGFAEYTLAQEGANLRIILDGSNSILLIGVDQASFTAADINIPLAGGGPNVIDGTPDAETLAGTAEVDIINGLGGNDSLLGQGADDELNGGEGNDGLNGGTGADTTDGGLGNDSHYVDNAGDTVIEAVGQGNDRVFAFVSYALDAGAEIETLSTNSDSGTGAIDLAGNAFDQKVIGNNGANALSGGAGADSLIGNGGDDTLEGGAGVDTFTGGTGADAYLFAAGDGQDVVLDFVPGEDFIEVSGFASYLLIQEGADLRVYFDADNSIVLRNTMAAAFDGSDINIPEAGANVITGTAAGETLTGTIAVDEIDGLGGNDTLFGLGNDDSLVGGLGNDVLHGGAGVDTTDGGAGNDNHWIDNAGDVIVEAAGQGTDRVFASASYVLAAGVSIEILGTFSDNATTAIDLTGNELNNTVVGNNGANVLDGGDGADSLLGGGGADDMVGGLGNDVLNGGAGADDMAGALGADSFYVDDAGDNVIEAVGEGADRIFASVSYTLDAGSEVETLSTVADAGATAINLTGNEFGQKVVGNNGANTLDGGAGADSVLGGGGTDTLIGGTGNDQLRGDAGTDEFLFNAGLFGHDTILDFANGTETIRFTGIAGVDDFSDLTVTAVGANARVTLPDGSMITINGMAGLIDASDFVFGGP